MLGLLSGLFSGSIEEDGGSSSAINSVTMNGMPSGQDQGNSDSDVQYIDIDADPLLDEDVNHNQYYDNDSDRQLLRRYRHDRLLAENEQGGFSLLDLFGVHLYSSQSDGRPNGDRRKNVVPSSLDRVDVNFDNAEENEEEEQERLKCESTMCADGFASATIYEIDPDTGDVYEGPSVNGIKHGPGASLTKLDGTKFLGSYLYNRPYEGTWVTSSHTYSGKVDRRGQFHGSWGVLAEQNQLEYQGEFHKGYYHGVGKEAYEVEAFAITPTENVPCVVEYKGNFIRGLRHGLGTMVVRRLLQEQRLKLRRQQHSPTTEDNATTFNVLGDDVNHPVAPTSTSTNKYEQPSITVTAEESWNSQDGRNPNNEDVGNTVVYMYSGLWDHGLKHGEGGSEVLSHETFVGPFVRDKRHGLGTLTFTTTNRKSAPSSTATAGTGTGRMVEKRGLWRAGLPVDGPDWTITFCDCSVYTGEARNGQPDGRGTMRYGTDATASRLKEYYQTHISMQEEEERQRQQKEQDTQRDQQERATRAPAARAILSSHNLLSEEDDPTSSSEQGAAATQSPASSSCLEHVVGTNIVETYDGEWRNGMRHGKGRCTYPNGEQYDGTWMNDEPVTLNAHVSYEKPTLQHSIQALEDGRSKSTKDMIDWDDLDLDQEDLDRFLEEFEEKKVESSTGTNRSPSTTKTSLEQTLQLEDVSKDSSQLQEQRTDSFRYLYPNGDALLGNIDEEGRRQGRGIYIFKNTGCRFEGDFVNDKREGKGVLLTASTKYIGEFRNDKKCGDGTLIWNDSSMYNGPFRDGMFHGNHGVLCESDGRQYKGEWACGLKHGAGEEKMPDGCVYVGEFANGLREGVGTLVNKEGEVIYSGTWKDGLMNGEGVLYTSPSTNPSGAAAAAPMLDTTETVAKESKPKDEYHGTFVRGKKSGHGKLIMANVNANGKGTMKGKWLRDKPVDGEWRVTHEHGAIFSGFATCPASSSDRDAEELMDGASSIITTPLPNGFGTIKFKNGDLYSGQLIDGKREGRGVCVFSNGDRWDGTWNNDAVDVDGTGVLTLADGTEHVFGEVASCLIDFA
jgi:hypothetical protein